MSERVINALAVVSLIIAVALSLGGELITDNPDTQRAQYRAFNGHLRALSITYTPPDFSAVIAGKETEDANAEIAITNVLACRSIYELVEHTKNAVIVKGYVMTYKGDFFLTMYAATVEQCGNTLGITASGKKVTTDPTCRTCAVDPSVIPLGTYLIIEGYDGIVWQATDTGSAVKGWHIDLYTDSEQESLTFPNVSGAKVWIVKKITV